MSKWGLGRVTFLAKLENIKIDVLSGWSVKSVYEKYGQHMDITYSQFARYVNRYIMPNMEVVSRKVKAVSAADDMTAKPTLPKTEIEQPTFSYNPQPPDRADLI